MNRRSWSHLIQTEFLTWWPALPTSLGAALAAVWPLLKLNKGVKLTEQFVEETIKKALPQRPEMSQ